MNKTTIFSVVVVVLLLGISMFAINQRSLSNRATISPTPSPTNIPSISSGPTTAVASPSNGLQQGGSSYRDPQGVFVILYPNNYQQDVMNEGKQVRIFKRGATQQGQTEMYDGVILVLETVNLEGKTLEQWVDASISAMTTDGTMQVTQPKTRTTLNNYPGFTYKMRGLGESTYTIIQKDSNSQFAVLITYAVHDPENVGYQSEVNNILSSLEILK